MPTQRFLNLKEEKKQIILEAAAHEFSRVPYSSASINQIIKEADISRGSFYTYFEDKDDLMGYMLRGFNENFQKKFFSAMEKEKGNPFTACVRLLQDRMAEGVSGLGYKMYQNMLTDMNVVNQNRFFGIQGFFMKDENYRNFVEKIYSRMDKERCKATVQTLAYGVDMAIMIGIKAITQYYKNPSDKEEILKLLKNEMRILETGLCGFAEEDMETCMRQKRGE